MNNHQNIMGYDKHNTTTPIKKCTSDEQVATNKQQK